MRTILRTCCCRSFRTRAKGTSGELVEWRLFEAGILFAWTEGIIPAPEATDAIRAVVIEAERSKKEGKGRVILFNLSGRGHLDLGAYDAYFADEPEDYALPKEAIARAMDEIKGLPTIG